MTRKELQALLDKYIAEHYKPNERIFSPPRHERVYSPPENMPRVMSFFMPQFSRADDFETLDFDRIFADTAGETFSEMLLRLIKKSGKRPSEIYRRADVDRQAFHKIKSDRYYHPSKDTVIAFAIALKLDLSTTQKLLKTAGYAFSDSSKRDVIISCFIEHEIFSVVKLNDKLLDYGEDVLFKRK